MYPALHHDDAARVPNSVVMNARASVAQDTTASARRFKTRRQVADLGFLQ